jgi:broad specificity phosphatase PhoE
LAARLSKVPLELIYTSDLRRAGETAQRIAARQSSVVPVIAMPELRECDYGQWEGLTRQEVALRFPEDWEAWNREGSAARPTGGEDAFDLIRRGGRAFDRAVREGSTVLISTHRVTLRSILCHALGLDPVLRDRFAVLNCSLTAVECRPEFPPRLLTLNDTCHLSGPEE